VAAAETMMAFMMRLLAKSPVTMVDISARNFPFGADTVIDISGPALQELVTRNGTIRELVVGSCDLSEDFSHGLSAAFRADLEITLSYCSLRNAGRAAADAFIECLHTDGSPLRLVDCDIDEAVLVNGLRGRSRVTTLSPNSYHYYGDAQVDRIYRLLFKAQADNSGLVKVRLYMDKINDENWVILMRSVQSHPTLEKISIHGSRNVHSKEQTALRIHALGGMAKANKKLHTVDLEGCLEPPETALFQELVAPHLEANRYRPRLQAIQQITDDTLRRKILLRALQSVRGNHKLFWMFLSGNADVACPCQPGVGSVVARRRTSTRKRGRSTR
jgi:hypothetical protein